MDRERGQSRGFGFVTFSTAAEAAAAVKASDQLLWQVCNSTLRRWPSDTYPFPRDGAKYLRAVAHAVYFTTLHTNIIYAVYFTTLHSAYQYYLITLHISHLCSEA